MLHVVYKYSCDIKSMHWHHAFVCTRTSHDIGCECMVWVDSRFSVDHGKSAPWCSINCRGDIVRLTLVDVDGGLGSMGHRPS